MINEILIFAELIVLYSLVVVFGKLFKSTGLTVWVAIATLLANIEVLVLVYAFGMEMTLGNTLFASTFLATDIISEIYGVEKSKRAANIGILTSAVFIVITLFWNFYVPSENDIAFAHLNPLFKSAPRVILASLIAYVVVERLDIFLYHRIWKATGDEGEKKDKYLWLRNNGATLISQLVNSILYSVLAFAGMYETKTLVSIIISSFVIFIATSLLDTPFVYLARRICGKMDKE